MEKESPGIIEEMLTFMWEVFVEILSTIWPVITFCAALFFWAVTAVFVLPCVWIAGNVYPMWVKFRDESGFGAFFFWVIMSVFILPCLFIANQIYPMWVEWTENF